MAPEFHTLYPFFGWDFHTLDVFNANTSLAMESPFSTVSDSSTGYLQDAIAQWTHRCKRQRVTTSHSDSFVQNNCNWNLEGDPFENDRCWNENAAIFSGDPLGSSLTGFSTMPRETKAQEATTYENERLSSSPSSCKDSMTDDPGGKESPVSRDPSSSERDCCKRKIITGKRVAYPFAVVKPGGVEGDVTLDEINKRILMRPTRPVRHPVGEFASHPCVSDHGPGLSGKAVVALTRIHTQGRGTVTIIRTRG